MSGPSKSGPTSLAINAARGEATAMIAGAPRRLCLTLGALAELEAAFGLCGWAALSERLRALSAADLLTVLAALLRGGGAAEREAQSWAAAATAPEAAQALARAFAAAA